MAQQNSQLLKILFVVLVFLAGVTSGVILDRQILAVYAAPAGTPEGAEEAFALIAEAWRTIDNEYVDRSAVENQRLAYGAIRGMVDALGDTGHSRFLDPESLRSHETGIRGEFEGIGAYVESRDGFTVIVAPIAGSPAQAAGLQPGDIILAVDGEDVRDLPLTDVTSRILGPAGTEVRLSVLTPDTGETRDVTIVRARVELPSLSWNQLPGTTLAHVRIVSFSEGVSAELGEALQAIKAAGLTGVVLDLRNNPGGLLSEAVSVGSHFLPAGEAILLRQDAAGNIDTLEAQGGGLGLDLPLVVLINEGSASASEIVSGALQDHGRATLVGATTFGTGTVLNQFNLRDGSALLLATEQWLTPDGRVIWHEGIAPDVAVELPEGVFPLAPEELEGMSAEDFANSDDPQLLRAIELLQQ